MGVVSKQVSQFLVRASQIADKALGPSTTLSSQCRCKPRAQPGHSISKAVSATRRGPGLSPVAKAGDLPDTRGWCLNTFQGSTTPPEPPIFNIGPPRGVAAGRPPRGASFCISMPPPWPPGGVGVAGRLAKKSEVWLSDPLIVF
jgi:hypothetical protein